MKVSKGRIMRACTHTDTPTMFYTTSTQHLRIRLPFRTGNATISRFTDGEIHVQINETVSDKTVWVIAATPAPADNYFELFFLLDALIRASARINLLITYFGYARQDRTQVGEAGGAVVISTFLKQFPVKAITIIHIHSHRLETYLLFKNIIPYELYYPIAREAEVIVAPDFGAHIFAQHIGKTCKIPVIVAEKKRISDNAVEIETLNGNVQGKRILIVDDMISTGSTIIKVCEHLEKQGAREINVMATHGVFAGDAREKIEQSSIKRVYVTNTLLQTYKSNKIEVIEISNVIKKIVSQK